jgi:hypothetical protein
MKSGRGGSTLVMVVLTLALVPLVPLASAGMPRAEMRTEADLVFDVSGATMHGEAAWSSEGFITSSGEAREDQRIASHLRRNSFKTAHPRKTAKEAEGEINTQIQLNVVGRTIAGPCDIYYWWNGRWVVKSGDGCAYV